MSDGMRYRDLREWIAAARGLGEVRDVKGATWQEDIGRITEMLHHTGDSPAVLFDDIPGYPSGFRTLANAKATRRRLALTLGLPLDIERRPVIDKFLDLTVADRAIKPRVVKDGPVFENVLRGADVDVLKFPAPFWHPLDGGRYLGTGVVDVLASAASACSTSSRSGSATPGNRARRDTSRRCAASARTSGPSSSSSMTTSTSPISTT